MAAASRATFGARRVEARASPPRGPRSPTARISRDLSRRVSRLSPDRRRGASRPAVGEPQNARDETATLKDSLPAHFDLDTSILLAGFAFEAYNSPEGGMRDEDVRGGKTAYVGDFVRDVFAGVLEVRVFSARGLPKADALGKSDPYVVLSVGSDDGKRPKGSARTSTKKNTLNPRWSDDDVCRLFARRDANAQTLTLDVFDEDGFPGKEDDFLGTYTVSFADLVRSDDESVDVLDPLASALRKVPGLESNRRVFRGVSLEGGPGGGEIDFSITFTPFNPPVREIASAGLKRAARLLREAEKNVRANEKTDAKTTKKAFDAARVARVVAREAARRLDKIESESNRKRDESSLWAVDTTNDWSVLASERRLKVRGVDANLETFSKACFVENEVTDTQCAVWRSRKRRDRTIVVAFRGTEMDRPLDFFTDANFKPAEFHYLDDDEPDANAEREKKKAPKLVHGGFLRAYESVRARVFAAVDDVIDAGGSKKNVVLEDDADERNADDDREPTWHVFVTGHSLGGALATLFACELGRSAKMGRRNVTVTMVNFGSPRVGDGAFCDEYNAFVPDSVRVVNRGDLVPTLPALLGYRHVDHGVRVTAGADGAAALAAAGDARRISLSAGDASDVEDEKTKIAIESEDASAAEKIVRLAEKLGVVGTLGVDAETAADAAEALSSLASLDALADHFEDEYLVALRAAKKV